MMDAPVASPRITPRRAARDVPSAAWDALARRGAHLHAWFDAAERSGAEARHIVVADADAGAGASADDIRLIVPAYLVKRADHDLHDRWLGPLRHAAPLAGVRLRPTLAVGAPVVQTSDLLGGPGALAALPTGTLQRVFDALEEQGRDDGARAVVWPFVDPASDRIVQVARDRGYAALYAGATAYLPVAWGRFEDYVASRSKSVRRTVRADLAALAAAGIRFEATADFRAHAGAVDALFRDFSRRRNGHETLLPATFFHHAAAVSPNVIAQLSWQGDRLVGTSLNLVAGGVADGTYAAFAAEYEGGPVYYNDLLYAPLRAACDAGVRRLELGPTALYAKVLRGAHLRRRLTLIRGTSRAAHAILAAWGRRIAERTERKELELLAPLGGFRCFH